MDNKIYQLKISLTNIFNPSPWRKVLVKGSTTLYELHQIIQVVMGWEDCHLFKFHKIKELEKEITLPCEGYDICPFSEIDAREITIADISPELKSRFKYLYDFGDCWEHTIFVEDIKKEDLDNPVCIGGKHSTPYEDSRNDYNDLIEFDIDKINERL